MWVHKPADVDRAPTSGVHASATPPSHLQHASRYCQSSSQNELIGLGTLTSPAHWFPAAVFANETAADFTTGGVVRARVRSTFATTKVTEAWRAPGERGRVMWVEWCIGAGAEVGSLTCKRLGPRVLRMCRRWSSEMKCRSAHSGALPRPRNTCRQKEIFKWIEAKEKQKQLSCRPVYRKGEEEHRGQFWRFPCCASWLTFPEATYGILMCIYNLIVLRIWSLMATKTVGNTSFNYLHGRAAVLSPSRAPCMIHFHAMHCIDCLISSEALATGKMENKGRKNALAQRYALLYHAHPAIKTSEAAGRHWGQRCGGWWGAGVDWDVTIEACEFVRAPANKRTDKQSNK